MNWLGILTSCSEIICGYVIWLGIVSNCSRVVCGNVNKMVSLWRCELDGILSICSEIVCGDVNWLIDVSSCSEIVCGDVLWARVVSKGLFVRVRSRLTSCELEEIV